MSDDASTPSSASRLQVLTMEETAKVLRCTRQHVYSLAAREGLPLTRLGGRTVVRETELDKWLALKTDKAKPEVA